MRIIEYELMPEALGSNGTFITKSGTVADLIMDTGMLTHADYDKIIPIHPELNKLLMRGSYPRSGEWEPFELSVEEYLEVVKYLVELPLPKPYRVDNYKTYDTE